MVLNVPILHIKELGVTAKAWGTKAGTWRREWWWHILSDRAMWRGVGVGTDTEGGIPPSISTIVCGSGEGQGSTLECYSVDTSGAGSRMDSGQPRVFRFGQFHS